MKGFDQKQANSFLVACEEGTIRGASERLDLEPSSVSRQIKALEEHLSVPLIERGRRGVKPTEAGDILLSYLKSQQSDYEVMLSSFDELRGMRRGELQIAVGSGFTSDLVGNALTSFIPALPGLTYSIQSGSTEQVVHSVKTDQAHFGITFNASPDRSIRILAQEQQPLKMLVSPESEFANASDHIPIKKLATLPCALLRPSFGVGALVGEVEALYGIRFRSIIETDSLVVLRSFVREGLGVTILPSFVVTRDISDGTIIAKAIDVPEFDRGNVAIIARQGRRLPEGATRLINHAVRSMSSFSRT
jgi:DNA-binding transcriptional LysR family regulator